MYEALIMIRPGNEDGALDRFLAAVEVSESFNDVGVARDDNRATLTHDGGDFRVYFSQEPHVPDESAEIAERFAAGHPDKALLAKSIARIELAGPLDDIDMRYFNDALLYAETAAKAVPGWWFDPAGGEFPGQ